jgi:hypothetical protein
MFKWFVDVHSRPVWVLSNAFDDISSRQTPGESVWFPTRTPFYSIFGPKSAPNRPNPLKQAFQIQLTGTAHFKWLSMFISQCLSSIKCVDDISSRQAVPGESVSGFPRGPPICDCWPKSAQNRPNPKQAFKYNSTKTEAHFKWLSCSFSVLSAWSSVKCIQWHFISTNDLPGESVSGFPAGTPFDPYLAQIGPKRGQNPWSDIQIQLHKVQTHFGNLSCSFSQSVTEFYQMHSLFHLDKRCLVKCLWIPSRDPHLTIFGPNRPKQAKSIEAWAFQKYNSADSSFGDCRVHSQSCLSSINHSLTVFISTNGAW